MSASIIKPSTPGALPPVSPSLDDQPVGLPPPPLSKGEPKIDEDLSGRKRLISNLYSGWLANGLQIVSGFILPRLISDRLGQGSLGVWDFGWAIVSYFGLLQGGIVSSINRYVAKYRVAGDSTNLNIAVNSVGGVLKGIAIIIALLTCLIAWIVPELMIAKLGGLVDEARWVVLLLGLTAAVQVQGAVYGGVLTGCHRWTVQNGIKSVAAILSVGGGVTVILLGGNITWLAGVMLGSEIVLRCSQRISAQKACPELKISMSYFSRSTAWEMFRFGSKTYVNVISQMLVNQTSSVLVATTFGVPALAIFSRPRSLVRAFCTVIDNNAMVLVPMVSALGAEAKISEIRDLTIAATRYAVFVCLPAILFLTLLGGDVMQMWMGPGYADVPLVGIFAVAGFNEAICFPLYRMLMGLNRHGKLGLLNLLSASVSVLLVAIVTLVFGGSLHWIAAAIAVPSLVVNAILLPRIAASVLKIKLSDMLTQIWIKPALCCIPAALWLLATVIFFKGTPLERISAGGLGAAVVSGWPYWKYAIPGSAKFSLRNRLFRIASREK